MKGNKMRQGKYRTSRKVPAWRKRFSTIGLVAALMVGGAAIAFASNGDDFINLADAGAEIEHDGAVFFQGPNPAGTGTFNPFLTHSTNADTSQGHNTDSAGAGDLDTYDAFFGGDRTLPLLVAAIPESEHNGDLYREFILDANDQGSDKCMSVDDIRIFTDSQMDLKGFDPLTEVFFNDDATAAVKVYDLDIPILMSSQRTGSPDCGGTGIGESGSGNADITVLIPTELFPEDCNYGNPDCDQWIYFWSEKGNFDATTLSDPGDVDNFDDYNWNVTAGFEEWNTRLLPVVAVSKTADPAFTITYPWTIEKLVAEGADALDGFEDVQTLDMFTGDSEDVTWQVSVTKGDGVTSGESVAGTVSILNPTGPGQIISDSIPATINSVNDVLSVGRFRHQRGP